MLPLLAHAAAARQKSQLHVLAEGGLREPHSTRREEVDDLRGGHAVRIVRLQSVELVDFALRHAGPSRWIETMPVNGIA